MDTENREQACLAFVGVATAYCSTLEGAAQMDREEFVAAMLRLLPRIYIAISSVEPYRGPDADGAAPWLDADGYERIRSAVAAVMADEDVYLETFQEDMKYSDTPIAANISEGLADIYQPLVNCAVGVRDSDGAMLEECVQACRDEFAEYWGQTLVNVLRPLHSVFYDRNDQN